MEEEIIPRTGVMREDEYLFHCLVIPKKLCLKRLKQDSLVKKCLNIKESYAIIFNNNLQSY